MKAHTRNDHSLMSPRKRVGLFFTNPFREAIWILVIGRMFFIQWKIIEARPATIGEPSRVDARSLTHTPDANFNSSTQGVVTRHHIVIVYFMIGMSPRRGD